MMLCFQLSEELPVVSGFFKGKIKLILISTIFVVLLVFLDQITKIIMTDALSSGPIPVIDGVLEFYYLENTGAAFSVLTGKTSIFILTTPVILLLILFFYIKMPLEKKYIPIRVVLLFILSGAIGNYIDRVTLGYVRDFIYFKLINFPVFNVADIYVTCSVFAFVFLFIFYYKEEDFDRIFSFKRKK